MDFKFIATSYDLTMFKIGKKIIDGFFLGIGAALGFEIVGEILIVISWAMP